MPFEEKVATITANLKNYFEQSAALQQTIAANLKKIGIELQAIGHWKVYKSPKFCNCKEGLQIHKNPLRTWF